MLNSEENKEENFELIEMQIPYIPLIHAMHQKQYLPTINKITKTWMINGQCNQAVLELIKQNMRWVKQGKTPPLQKSCPSI